MFCYLDVHLNNLLNSNANLSILKKNKNTLPKPS